MVSEMIFDQVAHLERQRAAAAEKLAKLQTGDWWHVGSWTDAHSRALAELNDIDYQLLCLKAGIQPRSDDR